jgi:hypothetical protein
MICGLQIGMLVFGIIALVKGRVKMGKKELRGGPARLVGILGVLPMPLTFAMGFFIGFYLASTGSMEAVQAAQEKGAFAFLDIGITLTCLVLGVFIALTRAVPVDEAPPAEAPFDAPPRQEESDLTSRK